jgi:hypothetical protein
MLRMLREVKKAAFLSGHSAQVILGKLGFCLQAAACKIGRAATQALVQRAAREDPKQTCADVLATHCSCDLASQCDSKCPRR